MQFLGSLLGKAKPIAFVGQGLHAHSRIGLYNFARYATKPASSKNYYEILELTPRASAAEIKASYYRLSKLYHPDSFKDETDNMYGIEGAKKFREVQDAYNVLSNINYKRLYDKGIFKEGYEIAEEPKEPAIPKPRTKTSIMELPSSITYEAKKFDEWHYRFEREEFYTLRRRNEMTVAGDIGFQYGFATKYLNTFLSVFFLIFLSQFQLRDAILQDVMREYGDKYVPEWV